MLSFAAVKTKAAKLGAPCAKSPGLSGPRRTGAWGSLPNSGRCPFSYWVTVQAPACSQRAALAGFSPPHPSRLAGGPRMRPSGHQMVELEPEATNN